MPGNQALSTTTPQAAAAMNLKMRLPHKRPAAQTPIAEAITVKIRPIGE